MLHKHRILPGHMGGTYAPENVVLLTISQHAEAHHQLFLEHGRLQDKCAWLMLSGQTVAGARVAQEMASAACRTPEFRAQAAAKAKGNQNWLGRKHSDDTKRRMSLIPKTAETRQKMSESAKHRPNNFLGKHHSEASRIRMSDSAKRRCQMQPRVGWVHSEESKMKMSETKRLHREQRMAGV